MTALTLSFTANRAAAAPANETVWFDDSLPAGAGGLGSSVDTWHWINANPTPISGATEHVSDVAAGQHSHWFGWSGSALPISTGDTLITYVYLDPAHPPAEIMLAWSTNTSWEHRAYWGADKIAIGSGAGRYHAGNLPPTGQWVRLEVPASAVGLEGQSVQSMSFTLFDGGATWDCTGKVAATAASTGFTLASALNSGTGSTSTSTTSGSTTTSTGSTASGSTSSTSVVSTLAANEKTWFDDGLPAGAGGMGASGGDSWNWTNTNPSPISGTQEHRSDAASGLHQHWFGWSGSPFAINSGESLFAYVYLDPANPPSELVVSWSTNGSWDHRAYWGTDKLKFGSGSGYYRAGDLPPAGQWVRLEVPASAVGMENATAVSMGFALYDGAATWDKTGKFTGSVASTGWTSTVASTSGSTSGSTSTSGSSTSTTSTSGGSTTGTTTTTTPSTSGGSTSTGSGSTSTSTSGGSTAVTSDQNETVFFDDSLPAGAGGMGSSGGDNWNWVNTGPAPISGSMAHRSDAASGMHQHWFGWANTSLNVGANDALSTYVYLDPANPPAEIMITWQTNGSWEHRAYWGADKITVGSGSGHYFAGALPPAGQWVRLEVPASAVGLTNANVTSMGFALYNGAATWDKSGKFTGTANLAGFSVMGSTSTSTGNTSGGTTTSGSSTSGSTSSGSTSTSTGTTSGGSTSSSGSTTTSGTSTSSTTTSGGTTSSGSTTSGSSTSTSSTSGGTTSGTSSTGTSSTTTTTVDTVWIDDALPIGAGGMSANGGDSWNWVTSNPAPYAGTKAHRSDLATGLHEHWFGWSGNLLPIFNGDSLYTYVYLDPANPPSEIMISWSTNSSWEHRAYWGANSIDRGSGTGHYYAGALPATGKWVRLEVPASAVGLEGQTVVSMGYALYNGAATWDASGKSGSLSNSGTSGGSTSSGSSTSSGTTSTSGSTSGGSTTGTTTTITMTSSGGVTSGTFVSPTSTVQPATFVTSGTKVSDKDVLARLPQVGDYGLRVLSPTVIELRRVLNKPANASFAEWNFVDGSGNLNLPSPSQFQVTANGQNVGVSSIGFRRIAAFGELMVRDLRVEACLYLTLSSPIGDGQNVVVKNPDSSLWPASMDFSQTTSATRVSPAIHVNEEGYVPSFSKKAMIGLYLGSKGELPVDGSKGFTLVNTSSGATVYTGTLTHRVETGYQTSPAPYQQVYEADFSTFTTPGEYQLVVPGMGASTPFLIADGIGMSITRAYEMGIFNQRCGFANEMPYTRFTRGACHTAAAEVPTSDSQYDFTWHVISSYSGGQSRQTAPQLTSASTQLYPFVNQGKVDVSGGHHDAGDYSKYTINVDQLAHSLLFTAENIGGASTLDNLGIPESGDGIPDLLQEGKWEADYVAKLQDADGGFYFIVYPKNREYEGDVSPEFGDQQVVWPKNTSATAASVAVLAEYASSPLFKKYYPTVAATYMAKAKLGWQFLMNAIAKYGKDGSYQRITFYGDEFMHDDELAWAAASMYAATGDTQYWNQLKAWFPNPADPNTWHWSWQKMYQGYGCAIRDYAFAARSGRLSSSQLDATYLATCEGQITAAGDEALNATTASAYGTSFAINIRHSMQTGWFFSLETAADIAVAYQINPKQAYFDAIVQNINYVLGCNPVNVSFLAGLGVKRPTQMVSQFRNTNRHVLPPIGEELSNVHSAFGYLPVYGSDLSGVTYPNDGTDGSSYWLQDRFTDVWNVTAEYVTVNLGHAIMAAAVVGAKDPAHTTAWKPTFSTATISVPAGTIAVGTPVTLSLNLNGLDVTNARITWEARDQLPAFGSTYKVMPYNSGAQWVEVEITYPDGRRVFLTGNYNAQ